MTNTDNIPQTQLYTVKQLYDDLPQLEQEELRDYVVNDLLQIEKILPEKQLCSCAHCQSANFVKNGTKNGKQRYLCRDCGRTFSECTGSVMARSRKSSSTWSKYIDCFLTKASLQTCAETCGITLTTAFMWRHKILGALQKKFASVVLDGIVESDETFFNLSYKGNHNKFPAKRPPRERGEPADSPGISKEKACLSCSITLGNQSVAQFANKGRPSISSLRKVLAGRIAPESTLVTDSLRAYIKLSKELDLAHVKIAPKRKKNGIFNIQKINNYHESLKELINRTCHSVSTRYINHYLIYQHILNVMKDSRHNKKVMILEILRDTPFTLYNKDVPNRPHIPYPA